MADNSIKTADAGTQYNTCPACHQPVPLKDRALSPPGIATKCRNCGTSLRESAAHVWRFIVVLFVVLAIFVVAGLILRLLFLAIVGVLVFLLLHLLWRRSYRSAQ